MTGVSDVSRILVVDDDRVTRAKLRLAVRNLGHETAEAPDGAKALDMLAEGGFDAVLLDIVMPHMDGYAVLRRMKADEDLRDIPVVVVSGLEEETESVVRAIELGAEDFLPKAFEAAILRARLDSSLRKKRFRDQERDQRRVVGRLIEAAEALESEQFRPDALSLEDVTRRDDPLGRFARVFQGMVLEIYAREVRLRRRVRTLMGAMLVLGVGVAFGLTAPLARLAAGQGGNPVGLVTWGLLIGAVLCLSAAALGGRLRWPSREEFLFYVFWAMLTGVAQKLALFWVSGNVPATAVSLVLTLKGFFTFTAAGALGIESVSIRRLAGLALGLGGAAIVILTRDSLVGADGLFWLLAAALLPSLHTVEGLGLATRRPPDIDPLAAVGFMQLIGFGMILPYAVASDALIPLGPVLGPREITVGIIALAGTLATVLSFQLVRVAGPVFASQTAYSCALAGIVWSMLLLGESLGATAWLALGLMLVGLYFVEPKESESDSAFRLPIRPERPLKRAAE
jgi:CheY-like chemotaxis protein